MSDRITKIGAFDVLAALCSGGMGEILLAKRRGKDQLLAVKLIRGELAGNPDVRAMFMDEARLLARLEHPGITRVIDFGEQHGALYMVMEYVDGVILDELRSEQRRLPPLIAVKMMADVCRALHAAHDATGAKGDDLGVVHRDVSPRNLMITFDGRMKVLDFGIAYMRTRAGRETQLGELKGKPSYMAPEQFRSEPVDRRTDVYAASVVLYELLTGRLLFTADSLSAMVVAVEKGAPGPPSMFAPNVSPELDAIVLRGLSREREVRFSDARTMADHLDDLWQKNGAPSLARFAESELGERRVLHQDWIRSLLAGSKRPLKDAPHSMFARFRRWLDGPPPAAPAAPARGPQQPKTFAPNLLPKMRDFASPLGDSIIDGLDRISDGLIRESGGRLFLSNVRRAIKNDGISLPHLPEAMLRLQKLASSPDVDIPDFVRAIQHDPPVAARFIGVANSAANGSIRRVSTVRDALVRIGLRQAGMVTMAIVSQSRVFSAAAARDLYQHALASATCAELIAALLPQQDRQEAFLAGLLHDLGRVFLRDIADQLRRQSRGKEKISDAALSAVEDELHAGIGGLIAQSSGLGDDLVQAIRFQHRPEDLEIPRARSLAYVLMAADGMARSKDGTIPPDAARAFQQLAIEMPPDLVQQSKKALLALRA